MGGIYVGIYVGICVRMRVGMGKGGCRAGKSLVRRAMKCRIPGRAKLRMTKGKTVQARLLSGATASLALLPV